MEPCKVSTTFWNVEMRASCTRTSVSQSLIHLFLFLKILCSLCASTQNFYRENRRRPKLAIELKRRRPGYLDDGQWQKDANNQKQDVWREKTPMYIYFSNWYHNISMMTWSCHFDSCILVTLILYQLLHRPTWECGLDFFHACFTILAGKRTQCGYICKCSISIGNVSMAGGWVDEITDSGSLIGRSLHIASAPPVCFSTNLIRM